MELYELTEAEADIFAIARYTIKTWGIDQARRYEVMLESHLQAIGRQKAELGWFSKQPAIARLANSASLYILPCARKTMSSDSGCVARKHGFDEPATPVLEILTSCGPSFTKLSIMDLAAGASRAGVLPDVVSISLQTLCWSDPVLGEAGGLLHLHATVNKNRKEQSLPLHSELVKALL